MECTCILRLQQDTQVSIAQQPRCSSRLYAHARPLHLISRFAAHFGKWHSEKTQLKRSDIFNVPGNTVAEVKTQYNQWLLYNVQRDLRKADGFEKAKTIKGWPYIAGLKYVEPSRSWFIGLHLVPASSVTINVSCCFRFENPPNIRDMIMKEYKENGVLVDMPSLATLTQVRSSPAMFGDCSAFNLTWTVFVRACVRTYAVDRESNYRLPSFHSHCKFGRRCRGQHASTFCVDGVILSSTCAALSHCRYAPAVR